MAQQAQMLAIKQVLDIPSSAGKIIIDTDNNGPVIQQSFAKVRSKKARTARDQNALFKVQVILLASSGVSYT